MSMNPWLAEQLAADRIHDLERAAREHGQESAATTTASLAPARTITTQARAPRRELTRHIGDVLISLGHRLGGSEGFPAALDSHR